jgi:serine/threonine protein kinase
MSKAPARLGKYETLEEIGRGGFAVVYKARDTKLDRVVALKVITGKPAQEPDVIARFRQEVRTPPTCAIPTSLRFTTLTSATTPSTWR